jgi:hypothetical protein
VPAVGQDDAQAPHQLAAPGLGIEQQPQPFEIHLGHLAGWRRRHTHCGAALAMAWSEPEPPGETLQGAVLDVQPALTEQFLHARELQLVVSQPGCDLLATRLQPIGLRRRPRPRSTDGPTHLDQPHDLVLGRRRPIGRQAELLRRAQILLHRLACHAAGAGDRALRLAHLPATNDLDDLHPTQLPIAHPAHLVVADRVMYRAAAGLLLREDRLD